MNVIDIYKLVNNFLFIECCQLWKLFSVVKCHVQCIFTSTYFTCTCIFLISIFSFPLYSKGKEQNLFRYGVFTLNKNISQVSASRLTIITGFKSWNFGAKHQKDIWKIFMKFQMRFYLGMGTVDLRTTLMNIKTLLENRLGLKP